MKTKYITIPTSRQRKTRDTITDAKKAAEGHATTFGETVEIYALIAVCHPPEIPACRWEELTAKKSDRDYDLVPLPEGIAPPPDGFSYFGKGPLKKPSDIHIDDIAIYEPAGWRAYCKGMSETNNYSLRIGSDIAKQNRIGGGE
jgi:hypothetical protein